MKARYYQSDAVQSVIDYLFSGKEGNPLVVMPTGTGKAYVIAKLMQDLLERWPNLRFINAIHVKELVKNNADTLARIWSNAPIGIYSAGLRKKQAEASITFGGIASMVGNPEAFGRIDLLFIDEAHLVSPKAEGNYIKFIEALKAVNPYLKVIGFTATPYRLQLGMLTEGGIFTDIVFDNSKLDDFNKLIGEGYLAPLYPKRTKTELDVSNVSIASGEFNQKEMQEAIDKEDVNYSACQEIVEHGQFAKAWLVFASGVEHCEHIAEMLSSFGVPTATVHSKLKEKERDERILDFKSGKLRCLVNNNVLTTGFDHPSIDLIGMLRPTTSPSLWVQMLGRGTRPSLPTGKKGCMVLDFAGNTRRLGPINDPVIPRRKGKGAGDAPIRICDACGTYNHASARVCVFCGAEFPRSQKLLGSAGTDALIRTNEQIIEEFNIDRVFYTKHIKRNGNGPPTLKVEYYSGLQSFPEWIAFEAEGAGRNLAKHWWKQRCPDGWAEMPPPTIDAALQVTDKLNPPKTMRVHVNKEYPEILSFGW